MTSASDVIRRWRANPIAFVRECLKADPEPWQEEVLRAYMKNPRVAMCASKGVGKTTILSWVALHTLFCFEDSNILATSITGKNLEDGLNKEMSKWAGAAQVFQDDFDFGKERIFHKRKPRTWWMSFRQWVRDADPTQQANTLAGLHNEVSLVLCDEVSDYPDGVVPAAEASLSGGKFNRIVIAGNPTRPAGPLYKACTSARGKWFVYNINGDPDNPNRSRRVDKSWAQSLIDEHGRESNIVKVNVLGEFPSSADNSLISLKLVQDALERRVSIAQYAPFPKILGVDVARFGTDATVIFPRQGPVAFKPKVFRELSLMDVCGVVVNAIDKFKPNAVFVDQTGMGAGVVDRLREMGFGVQGVEFGAKATESGQYFNRRTEMWDKLREWLAHGCLPDDPTLVSDLTAPIYRFHSTGQKKLESKDELKARTGRSPDLGDALALCFASSVSMGVNDEVKIEINPLFDSGGEKKEEVEKEYEPFNSPLDRRQGRVRRW